MSKEKEIGLEGYSDMRKGELVAQQRKAELVIHGADGQIREKSSFGNDPPEIPG